MIPFATLFTAVYYIIYLGHAYFLTLDEINKMEVKELSDHCFEIISKPLVKKYPNLY